MFADLMGQQPCSICRTDAETSGATAADAGFAVETKGLPIAPPQSRFANFVEIV